MFKSSSKNKISLRASSIEIYKRDILISNDDKKIYSRDVDNLYPIRIEGIINNSPTARRCANMMSKFISGLGIDNDFVINKKGETIGDIIDQSANDISYHYGVFFLVKYIIDEENLSNGLIFKVGNLEVLDYVSVAKSKQDDNDYQGKFYRLEMDYKTNSFKKVSDETPYFYPFNKNTEVILSQMIKDCKDKGIDNPTPADMIKHQRGQVYYLNLTPKYIYALPLVDSVYNDCDTEYRISLYNNKQTRSGFLGKTIITKFKDDEFEDFDNERRTAENSFNEEIKDSLGVEGSSDVLVIDVGASSEDVNKVFSVNQVKAQFDDKLFEHLEKSTKRKIMGAFNNIPEALVFGGEGALFGTNSDTYTEMKKFYWEQNTRERNMIEKTLKLFGFDVKIKPVI